MTSSNKTARRNSNIPNQSFIVRFRSSADFYERLKKLAQEEELHLSTFVRKLVLDSLKKFPD
jgi:hypothetical protein